MRTLLLLLLLALPGAVAAQQDSLLDVAVRLTTEGQGDSARTLIRSRLRRLSPSEPAYPQVLFTAGVVAEHADSAATYFRRVSIEYSSSAWADSSLLRLAQLAYASGDMAGALRAARRLLMDYPFSPVLAEAGYWAGRAHLELDSVAAGCDLLAQAATLAGENVELANRVRFYRQRCPTVIAGAGDSAPAPPAVAPPVATGRPVYAVQVAAVRSAGAADDVMRRLNAAGHQPHVVRDADGLFKVRVGRFARREEAQRLAADLRRSFGGNPFVVEES